MYNKKDIVKSLNEFNYFIDESTLSSFIKNWKIDAIYEDEDGVEFFDNLAIAKLKKGISLKSQGFTNEQITYHVNKLLPEKMGKEEKKAKKEKEVKEVNDYGEKQEVLAIPTEESPIGGELKNVTIDVTSKTLQMLADAVAEKITAEFKNSSFVTQLLEDGALKKDNEVLSKQIEELTEDNKKLAKRVEELERSKKTSLINFEYFRKFFG